MATVVMVRSCEVRKTRKQENFLALRVNLGQAGDFAEIEAKVWGADGLAAHGLVPPASGDLIDADYQADEYQGRPQWIIRNYRILDEAQRASALAQFAPPERIDREFYRQKLDDLIDLTSPERPCGLILREIFDQAGFREDFYQAPAARDHHQNYPGGLLEHTVNVTSLALAMAGAYAIPPRPDCPGQPGLTFNNQTVRIDRQTLVAAGLLHDIGKLHTYHFDPLPEVTDGQRWTGHLVISYAIVHECVMRLFPAIGPGGIDRGADDQIGKLLHCILAHHGSLEYGSPVVPACAEAFLLAQADMTDARLAEIAELGNAACEKDPGARWLPRQMHFPGGVFIGAWETRPAPEA